MKKFRLQKFKYAIDGLYNAFITESTLCILSLFLILQVSLGFYFNISGIEFIIIILFSSITIAAELLNTVVEKLCDIFTQGWLVKEVGFIKDVCAGAVLFLSTGSFIVFLIIFIPEFRLLMG